MGAQLPILNAKILMLGDAYSNYGPGNERYQISTKDMLKVRNINNDKNADKKGKHNEGRKG